MSSHLAWEPEITTPPGSFLTTTTKHLLAERFADGDSNALPGVIIDEMSIPWLGGCRDACGPASGVREDMEALIVAVRAYKRIRLVHA